MVESTTYVGLGDATDEYLALVRAFPLVSIRDAAHLDAAIQVIDRLIDKPENDRSEAEEAYLGALTDLVETYEAAHVHIPPVSGVAMVRHLMEARDLTQNDLIPIFGTASIVSEVLNEKRRRKLTVDHIKKLAPFFHVSPATFIEA